MNISNYIFWVLCFFFSATILAQNQGVVTYKKRMVSLISEKEETKKIAKEKPRYYRTIVNMDNNMKLVLEHLDFSLKFTNNKAVFEAEPTLENEKNKFLKGALGYGLGTGLYYINKETNELLHQIKMIGKTFIIEPPNTKWNLINETKKIGKYTCFKAVATKKTEKKNGDIHENEIIAWYAPEIPIQFGPVGFGGLPGLIIHLEYGGIVDFKVTKIEFDPEKTVKIQKPQKGEYVSEEEFYRQLDSTMDRLKN